MKKTSSEYSNFKYLIPMKDIFFGAIFLLTFFSCSEEQPNDALSYNDIGAIPNVVSKTEPEDILILDTLTIDFNSDLFQNISGLKIDSLQPLSKKSILDRGQHLNSNKTIVFIKDSSFEYKEWLFQDKVDLQNAFYNLIDCFGNNCESIDLYDTTFEAETYHLVYVSHKTIHWVSSAQNQKRRNWTLYLKKQHPTTKYNFVFEIRIDEPIEWFEDYENGLQSKTETND